MKTMNSGKFPQPVDIRKIDKFGNDNPRFQTACTNAQSSGMPQDYSGQLGWVYDNGAIANYNVNYSGRVRERSGSFVWEGTVDFADRFDLDPRWTWSATNTQGRSALGERRTRLGYILNLGTDFDIKSAKTRASQESDDKSISFLD
jgi:hypothetical protein